MHGVMGSSAGVEGRGAGERGEKGMIIRTMFAEMREGQGRMEIGNANRLVLCAGDCA